MIIGFPYHICQSLTIYFAFNMFPNYLVTNSLLLIKWLGHASVTANCAQSNTYLICFIFFYLKKCKYKYGTACTSLACVELYNSTKTFYRIIILSDTFWIWLFTAVALAEIVHHELSYRCIGLSIQILVVWYLSKP